MPELQDRIASGRRFLQAAKRYYDENQDAMDASRVVVKELKIDYDVYKKFSKSASLLEDPKRAGVVVTVMLIQKGMTAANLKTTEETKACLEAVMNLAGDFGTAAVLGPETLGVGALLPLVLAAMDSYDVGRSCFVGDGPATHAVVAKVRDAAELGEKLIRH